MGGYHKLHIRACSTPTIFHNYAYRMSDPFSNEPSRDRNRRDDSVFHPPSYNISHGPDKALQWDPPADSDELAIALSYHFPIQKTLKKKMQAAVEKFLQQAKPRRPDLVEFNQDLSPSRSGAVRRISEAIPGLLSFDATTLEEVKVKRKRRAYETGLSHPSHVVPQSFFQGAKPPNEPINELFSSNGNQSAPGKVPGSANFNRRPLPDEMEGGSSAERESQFMGFEPGLSPFDDSFSFSLDPPFFLSLQGDTDTRYSWKPDEFLLSVLSHSMFA